MLCNSARAPRRPVSPTGGNNTIESDSLVLRVAEIILSAFLLRSHTTVMAKYVVQIDSEKYCEGNRRQRLYLLETGVPVSYKTVKQIAYKDF